MRVVYFGSGEFAVPTLRWLINSPHEIARGGDAAGSAGRSRQEADAHAGRPRSREGSGLTVHKVEDANDAEFVEQMGSSAG